MATVYLDAGVSPKYASIKVEFNGKPIHSEQLGTPGRDAVGAFYSGKVSDMSFAIRIPLPNAKRAQDFQRGTEGYVFDPYDLDEQSCVTYCADVSRAGGIGPEDLPEGMNTDEVERWLLSKF